MKLIEQLERCKTPFQKKYLKILIHFYWEDYKTDIVIPDCDVKDVKNLYLKLKKLCSEQLKIEKI